MLRTLLIAGAVIAIIAGKYAWRSHQRTERQRQAMMNQFVPAMNSMSAEVITGSDWSYSGPLGEMTLRFEPDGKLTATSEGTTDTGRWEIKNVILIAHIPGADEPHQGLFRTSTDELAGISPKGLEPPKWSAIRVR